MKNRRSKNHQPSPFTLTFAVLSLLVASGCSSLIGANKKASLGRAPEFSTTQDIETIAIVGTNDIHGALNPIDLKTREVDGASSISYQAGGAVYLASYLRILHAKYGDKLLWLDGGDQFQGTLESNTFYGEPMVEFFNRLGLKASAIGNHEFDFGPGQNPDRTQIQSVLLDRLRQAQYPYIASNIRDKKTKALTPLIPTVTRTLKQIGRVKVGIIGLSTLDTPTTTRAEFVSNLEFEDLKNATLRESSALKKEGAQIIVVTAHAGLKCDKGKVTPTLTLRKETDPQGECESRDEMVQFLRSLPRGTVDAVVSGHSHTIVHHWIAGTPIIQSGANARYFNVIYLSYDLKNQTLITEKTRIEGPVPVCAKVFENQNDCNGDRPAPPEGRGKLIEASFRDQKIDKDSEFEAFMQPFFAKTETLKKEVITQAARPVDHTRKEESELGNLAADSLRLSVGADFALMNAGGIRAPFESGPITFGDVFKTFPFDNSVSLLHLTGKEVKLLYRIAESGSRGFFPTSGLKLTAIMLDGDAKSSDLNGDGKIDPWEIDRLISIKTADDKPIEDKKMYKVATIDFLVTGGDDLGWFMKQIPPSRIVLNAGPLARDAVVSRLKELGKNGPVNSLQNPLVDPKSPRLTLVKAAPKATKKRRTKKSKSKRG